MKYLNDEGLAVFWSICLEKFASKLSIPDVMTSQEMAALINEVYSDPTGSSPLAAVALTGRYEDLIDEPPRATDSDIDALFEVDSE